MSGPDKGAILSLSPGVQTLGRSAAHCDLVVGGRGLSRSHARLTVDSAGQVELEDLGSTNGCFINGDRVQRALLKNGDTIGLGPEVLLQLEYPDSAVHELMEDLYKGATLDPLTEVLNRRSIMERLGQEFSVTRRHGLDNCVAMVDIDHFKKINDTYGHPAGDAVIKGLARMLADGVRQEDEVGRYGGEEFIVIIRQSSLAGAVQMLERLRKGVEQASFTVPTPDGETTINITTSIGVASLDSVDSPEVGVANADEALYKAKTGGRNRVVAAEGV